MGEQNNSSSRVDVHSIMTAVSSRPIGSDKTYPLTQLDHAMGRHTVHLVYYYEKNVIGDFDRVSNMLRVSLSEVLALYPNVTGRLTRGECGGGNWEVKCNDAGVRVVRARVGVTIDEWLRSAADGIDERDLTVWEDMPPESPSTWSPFRIQINDFEGGGVAIGLSCSHMNADLTSLALLFKAWTEIHRHQPVAYPPVFQPIAPNSELVSTKSTNFFATKSKTQTPSVKMATTTFNFSDSIIKRNLSDIDDKCPNATPFDLLAALFWTRISHVKGHERTQSLSVCVDFRRRFHQPLPYGNFGNAMHFSLLSLNEDSDGLGHVAELVHRHVVSLEEEEFLSGIQWLESQKGEGGKYVTPFTMYGPELTCVNMEHMVVGNQSMMYTTSFDSAKPVHVSCHVGNVEGDGLIVVMPSEGLARTVIVTLPEEEMTKLCEDQDILRLEPTILLGGKL